MTTPPEHQPEYGIQELAELGGVSRRTVRYYVERGILPAPTGVGRGKHYTREHLATLFEVRQLQEAGVPLEEILRRRGVPAAPTPAAPTQRPVPAFLPAGALWERVRLGEGVELHVRAGVLDSERLAAVRLAAARALLGHPPSDHEETSR